MISFHTLLDNNPIAEDDLARARDRAHRVQVAFDAQGGSHTAEAANLWKDLVPPKGTLLARVHRCNDPGAESEDAGSDDRHRINLLRLRAPFSGYFSAILDRLDSPRFPAVRPETLTYILAGTTPEIVWQRMCEHLDPFARMLGAVPGHLAAIRNIPARYIVRTPAAFGEMGALVDGVLCNADTILCQTRINALYAGGVFNHVEQVIERKGTCRILEIGSGHGGLALALMKIFDGHIEYVCCDLPSSLHYSAVYLGHFIGKSKVITPCDTDIGALAGTEHCLFVPNYLIGEVVNQDNKIDLAINTMSMPEMSPEQVHEYASLVAHCLNDGGVFYEANNVVLPEHTDCKRIMGEYFPFRRPIMRPDSPYSLGGEMHEAWSLAPFPWAGAPGGVAVDARQRDLEEIVIMDSCGRTFLEAVRQLDDAARTQMLIRASQHMIAQGMSPAAASRLYKAV